MFKRDANASLKWRRVMQCGNVARGLAGKVWLPVRGSDFLRVLAQSASVLQKEGGGRVEGEMHGGLRTRDAHLPSK